MSEYTIDDPRIEIMPWTGCWIWTGPSNQGYGRIEGVSGPAYKHFWERAGNRLTAGHSLDHICRARACVNPEHLRSIPKAQNNSENKYCPAREGTLNQFGFLYFYDPDINEGFPPASYLDRHPELASVYLDKRHYHRKRYLKYLKSATSTTE